MVKGLLSHFWLVLWLGFSGGASGKESICQGRRCKRCRFALWVRKIPGSKKWQFTPVFLLGKFYDRETWWPTPRGHRELDRTQQIEHLTGSSDIWQLSLFFSLPSHPASRQKKATRSLNKTGSCGLHWISLKWTYRSILGEEEGQLISTNIPIYFSNSI